VALIVRGLVKSYGTKRVLEGVDLAVEAGQIHALLGPNGSGKSTLIGCLSGAVIPDGGVIEIDGVERRSLSPRDAILAGTAVIYQNFSLVPTLTVADNIFLGDERRTRGHIDHARQRVEAAELLESFGRPIRPEVPVSHLSVGDRQLVEIAKALRRRPRVLILDEPTAALGEQEARYLGQHLQRLRDDGLAILYVTHILPEVFAIADRLTVLRDGRVVLAAPVAEVDARFVINAIAPAVKSAIVDDEAATANALGPTALELSETCVDGIGPVSVNVRHGEVVALFGLLGSGRTEIVEGVFGTRRVTAGTIAVEGRAFTPSSPAAALRAGVALVAGDRRRQSILDKMSSIDNMLLPHFTRLSRWRARDRKRERAEFAAVAERLHLQPNDPRALAWTFSGGNQQKLAVGRWLAAAAGVHVLLLDEPTQGIDVGARADLYALVRILASEGKAVMFTSSDPAETLALADRVLVLRRGRIVAELDRRDCDEHRILALAHGADRDLPTPTSMLQEA
jgi:ribose transport system ATP-binding protein